MAFKIINDGYTEDGYIAAVEGVHDALAFRFRPMLAEQRDEILRLEKLSATLAHACSREILAEKIVEWNVADDQGKLLPINDGSLKGFRGRLSPVFDKLVSIVAGWVASDPKPGATDKPVSGVEREEADEKN